MPNMPLRLDTSGIAFTVGSDFEPVTDYATKQPKADANGVPLVQVSLVASFKTAWGKVQSDPLEPERQERGRLPGDGAGAGGDQGGLVTDDRPTDDRPSPRHVRDCSTIASCDWNPMADPGVFPDCQRRPKCPWVLRRR